MAISKYHGKAVQRCLDILQDDWIMIDGQVHLGVDGMLKIKANLKALFVSCKPGRVKGVGLGCGATQKFFKAKGGKEYLADLLKRFRSCNRIVIFLEGTEKFRCSPYSVSNALKYYGIPYGRR